MIDVKILRGKIYMAFIRNFEPQFLNPYIPEHVKRFYEDHKPGDNMNASLNNFLRYGRYEQGRYHQDLKNKSLADILRLSDKEVNTLINFMQMCRLNKIVLLSNNKYKPPHPNHHHHGCHDHKHHFKHECCRKCRHRFPENCRKCELIEQEEAEKENNKQEEVIDKAVIKSYKRLYKDDLFFKLLACLNGRPVNLPMFFNSLDLDEDFFYYGLIKDMYRWFIIYLQYCKDHGVNDLYTPCVMDLSKFNADIKTIQNKTKKYIINMKILYAMTDRYEILEDKDSIITSKKELQHMIKDILSEIVPPANDEDNNGDSSGDTNTDGEDEDNVVNPPEGNVDPDIDTDTNGGEDLVDPDEITDEEVLQMILRN